MSLKYLKYNSVDGKFFFHKINLKINSTIAFQVSILELLYYLGYAVLRETLVSAGTN